MLELIGLLISFAVIILLLRMGRDFGVAMLLASVVLAIFSFESLSFDGLVSVFWESFSLDNILLIFGILLIGILANVMKETGEVRSIIDNLRAFMPRESILATIPAVFGLLPIPGGALMSAPMIDKEADKIGVSDEDRTFLNVWFRHIGFLIFPENKYILDKHAHIPHLFWIWMSLGPNFEGQDTKDQISPHRVNIFIYNGLRLCGSNLFLERQFIFAKFSR